MYLEGQVGLLGHSKKPINRSIQPQSKSIHPTSKSKKKCEKERTRRLLDNEENEKEDQKFGTVFGPPTPHTHKEIRASICCREAELPYHQEVILWC